MRTHSTIKPCGKSLLVILAVAGLTACGKNSAAQAQPYLKKAGWTSVCLGPLVLDWPDRVDVAQGEMLHHSGYGFDGMQGAATTAQRVNRMDIQETPTATLKNLRSIKGAAMFKNISEPLMRLSQDDPKRVEFLKHARDVDLNDPGAYATRSYGNYDIGYLDAADHRIRLFEGGLPGDRPEKSYTDADLQSFYKHLRTEVYKARAPQDLPAEPGVCTPFGFFRQGNGAPIMDYSIEIPVRSLKYPSLVFFMHVRPADKAAPADVRDLPDPNHVSKEDIKALKGMEPLMLLQNLANMKQTIGPEPIGFAGQAGRFFAREYIHKGVLDASGDGPGAAYEMQADVLGVQGKPDMPAITLKMAAMLPDPYPYPPPTKERIFGMTKTVPYVPVRPAIKGVKTPPFEEGQAYFKQVLASVRPLPALVGAKQEVIKPSQSGEASSTTPASPSPAATEAKR